MFNEKLSKFIFLTVFLFSLIIPIFFYNNLPDKVASHFNFRNEADAWMNKSSYIFFHYGLIIFFTLTFVGLAYIIPKLPKTLINIPNKDYWLNEKRKDFTFLILRTLLFHLATLCILLFIVVDYLVYNANINGTNKLWSFSWFVIIIFLFATGYFTIKFILFFNNKENQTGDE